MSMLNLFVTDDTETMEVSKTKPTPKRKPKNPKGSLSSDDDGPVLKRQNSLPDISALSSKKGTPFNEMVAKTFNDQSFISMISPALTAMIAPLINKPMESAIEKLTTSLLQPLIESQQKLMDTVKAQDDTIKIQNVLLEEKSKVVDNLRSEIVSHNKNVEVLDTELNDLQQYCRRNSLRIHNLKVPTESSTNELQLTNFVASFINTNVIKPLETGFKHVTSDDIERCHPVGKGTNRQILVKFSRYHTKRAVFISKKNLKTCPGKIFITEDLTKCNHELMKVCLTARFQKRVSSVWTKDGKVFLRVSDSSTPVLIRSKVDVDNILK